jgi:methyltransferase (TIGR00027 family)
VEAGQASITAIATALMRAAHTRLDDPRLIDDPWGDRLIFAGEREAMRAGGGGGEDADATLRAHPSYGTVIMRTRYAEDMLAAAVASGVRQYVIIGAGLDSFALRRPAVARELEIFEVDHPDTQRFKAERLAACEIPSPDAHLVAADLSATRLDAALASSPFRSGEPAFFSWLGVTTYLTREANLATLAAVAACASPGSELVFSFTDQAAFDSPGKHERLQRARSRVAAIGEPWISGFHPERLAEDLHGVGLLLVEDLGPQELQARYCSARSDGLGASPGAHVARARIEG